MRLDGGAGQAEGTDGRVAGRAGHREVLQGVGGLGGHRVARQLTPWPADTGRWPGRIDACPRPWPEVDARRNPKRGARLAPMHTLPTPPRLLRPRRVLPSLASSHACGSAAAPRRPSPSASLAPRQPPARARIRTPRSASTRPATQRRSGADRPGGRDRRPEARPARRPADRGPDAVGAGRRAAGRSLTSTTRAASSPATSSIRSSSQPGRGDVRRSRCAKATARATSSASRSPSSSGRSSTSASWRPAPTRSATRPAARPRSPSRSPSPSRPGRRPDARSDPVRRRLRPSCATIGR